MSRRRPARREKKRGGSRLCHDVDLGRLPTDDLFMVGDPSCDKRERGEVEERGLVVGIAAIRRLLQ
jgi:hypothetical protein